MNQAMLGILVIVGFLVVCLGEAVVIIVLSYKLGTYKAKLARYESAEKQSPAKES